MLYEEGVYGFAFDFTKVVWIIFAKCVEWWALRAYRDGRHEQVKRKQSPYLYKRPFIIVVFCFLRGKDGNEPFRQFFCSPTLHNFRAVFVGRVIARPHVGAAGCVPCKDGPSASRHHKEPICT